jgi:rRNA maturation endonuclease Nob1
MKTKEEIEQLADEWLTETPIKEWGGAENGFIKGYTQCQEDMVDTIKKAIEFGYQLRNDHKPINSGIDWVKEFNSLKKQFDIFCPKCGGDSWKFNSVKTTIKCCKCGNDF